ncbi:MAG TPA: DUF234 domain-containing protein [Micromonosporaceae bacterium]|nr:DUF234 domain-containing protein [Micromonosporaceae bacterium]
MLYEIADGYLAFWLAVLRDDADLIEGGQGAAVRQRAKGRWETHLARVFEEAARDHAQRMVRSGVLPAETVIGRRWRDETAEIDVLGLAGADPVLVGECRWQAKPIVVRDLAELRRRTAHLPPVRADATYAFWSRGGADAEVTGHSDVRVFTTADILDQKPSG